MVTDLFTVLEIEKKISRLSLIQKPGNQTYHGHSQEFSKGGGGGHTGSNNIVMAFTPRTIVGYLLKKRLTKGGSQAPQDPPLATPIPTILVVGF